MSASHGCKDCQMQHQRLLETPVVASRSCQTTSPLRIQAHRQDAHPFSSFIEISMTPPGSKNLLHDTLGLLQYSYHLTYEQAAFTQIQPLAHSAIEARSLTRPFCHHSSIASHLPNIVLSQPDLVVADHLHATLHIRRLLCMHGRKITASPTTLKFGQRNNREERPLRFMKRGPAGGY